MLFFWTLWAFHYILEDQKERRKMRNKLTAEKYVDIQMIHSACVSGPHDLLTFVIFGMMAEAIKLKAARKKYILAFYLSLSA